MEKMIVVMKSVSPSIENKATPSAAGAYAVPEWAYNQIFNAGLEEAAKVAENHGTNKDAPSSFYDDMDWCYIVDDVAAAIRKTINRTQGGAA